MPVYNSLDFNLADRTDTSVCGEVIKYICSAGLLRDMRYGLQLHRVPLVVRLCGGMEVLIVVYFENGMP